jgi:AI-2 transport protein TqsA
MSYNQRFAILQRMRPDIAYALTKFSTGTRNYLVVSTVFGFIVALLDTGALWLMGIPLPILWGCCRSSRTTSRTSASSSA